MLIAAPLSTVDNGNMTTGSSTPSFNDRPLPRRSGTGRIAGVCEGLGDAVGLDPSLVRIAFAVLALASGAGVVAYLGAWLLMLPPDAGSYTVRVDDSDSQRPTLALIFGGVLLGVGLLVGLMTLDGIDVLPATIIGLVFVGIVLLNRKSQQAETMLAGGSGTPPPMPPPPMPPAPQGPDGFGGAPWPAPPGPTPTPAAPLIPPDPTPWPPPAEPATPAAEDPTEEADQTEQTDPTEEADQTEVFEVAPPPPVPTLATDPPPPAVEPTLPQAQRITEHFLDQDVRQLQEEIAGTDFGSLGVQGVDLHDDLPRGHWALARTEHETSLAAPDNRYNPGLPLASITLAALALLTGIGLVFNTLIGETVKAATLAGAGTAIVGIAVVISAYTGRTLRLIPIAIGSLILLMMAPFLDFAIADGVGSSEIRVSSNASLQDYYGVGIGYLELRLDDLVITEDTEIDIHVGVGAMEITVPPNTDVELRGSTQAGYIFLLDSERAGINQTYTRNPTTQANEDGTAKPRLIIDAETTIGEVYIQRGSGG